MRKQFFVRLSLLITLALFGCLSASGQNAGNEIKLMFSLHEDGKIATLNAEGQKVFNFSTQGIVNKKQADDLAQKFRGKEYVVNVNMIEPSNKNNQYTGVIVLNRLAKIADFKKLLTNAGFTNIYVDGKLTKVENLDMLKKNTTKKLNK